jgi:hypothetical protein
MSHSPGNWSVVDLDGKSMGIRAEISNAETPSNLANYYDSIATVMQRDPHPIYGCGITRSECKDNARLISAAPDLLAALQSLIGHVAHYAAMPHAHKDAHKDVANAYAAINKAKGKP